MPNSSSKSSAVATESARLRFESGGRDESSNNDALEASCATSEEVWCDEEEEEEEDEEEEEEEGFGASVAALSGGAVRIAASQLASSPWSQLPS